MRNLAGAAGASAGGGAASASAIGAASAGLTAASLEAGAWTTGAASRAPPHATSRHTINSLTAVTLHQAARYGGAMTFSAEFRCIAGCAGGYALDEVIYRCPKCGA